MRTSVRVLKSEPACRAARAAFQTAVVIPREHPMLRLQRIVGNRAVQRLIRGRKKPDDFPQAGLPGMPLMLGAPGDRYEAEADHVMSGLATASEPARSSGARAADVQRMCNQCEDELNRSPAAGAAGGHSMPPPLQASVARAMRSPAEPLSGSARAFFEPRLGHDLGSVRVHAGADAARSADALGARAYTVGNDIVFGAGEYAPATQAGRKLLAHELTHVVQQSGGGAATRASPVRERTSGPIVQGAWKLAGITHETPVVAISHRDYARAYPMPLFMGVSGIAKAWQKGFPNVWIEGGNAQLMLRTVSRFRYEHQGDDNNVLKLHIGANIFGGAEADDLHYAQARGAIVGNMVVRTQAGAAPAPVPVFPPGGGPEGSPGVIDAGGKSEAKKTQIGEMDAEIPVGDKTVNVKIPLTTTDEGQLAHIAKSATVTPNVTGDGIWKSVDVYLVAYIDAAADTETEFWGTDSDVNRAHVTAKYSLTMEERVVPPTPPAPEAEGELEAAAEVSCRNPPGCTPDRCRDLQKEVKRLCDQRRACKEGMSCKVAQTYHDRSVKCANARRRINDECFNGGDRDHRRAENSARHAAAKCRDLIRKGKCRE